MLDGMNAGNVEKIELINSIAERYIDFDAIDAIGIFWPAKL